MSPDDVSVVDQSGRLLSHAAGQGDDGADKQVALQTKIEDRYRQALASLLTPIVGDGNFTAEVHADLDFARGGLDHRDLSQGRRGRPHRAGQLGEQSGRLEPAGVGHSGRAVQHRAGAGQARRNGERPAPAGRRQRSGRAGRAAGTGRRRRAAEAQRNLQPQL